MKLTLIFNKKSIEIPEGQKEFSIGRNRGDIKNNLDIPIQDVSRKHCTVIQNEKGIYLRDDGSKNGTFVNGKQIKDDMRATLQDGDEITLGKNETLIIVKIDDGKGEELKIDDGKGEELKLADEETTTEKLSDSQAAKDLADIDAEIEAAGNGDEKTSKKS